MADGCIRSCGMDGDALADVQQAGPSTSAVRLKEFLNIPHGYSA